jgi:3-methyl-2-oxobutanoate hydroxymethyltransferase
MRVSINQVKEMKAKNEKIVMLTAYDYSIAKLVDEAGIPLILVGDSLGMVILGYESTIPVTMDDMIHHTKAVVRGTKQSMIIGDMPFMTYHTSTADAMRNTTETAERLFKDAKALEQAGAFAVVLELVPAPLSKLITQKLGIPTIGIGAGPDCDGQVQVISDLLGLFSDFVPKHAKQYAKLAGSIRTALADYITEVKAGKFPTPQNSSTMDESLLEELARV